MMKTVITFLLAVALAMGFISSAGAQDCRELCGRWEATSHFVGGMFAGTTGHVIFDFKSPTRDKAIGWNQNGEMLMAEWNSR